VHNAHAGDDETIEVKEIMEDKGAE
jgi:hypothetical protein